jgi:hypothetical protein
MESSQKIEKIEHPMRKKPWPLKRGLSPFITIHAEIGKRKRFSATLK